MSKLVKSYHAECTSRRVNAWSPNPDTKARCTVVPTTYTYVPVLDVEACQSSGSLSTMLDPITVMVGTPSIVMPSALEAASAVVC